MVYLKPMRLSPRSIHFYMYISGNEHFRSANIPLAFICLITFGSTGFGAESLTNGVDSGRMIYREGHDNSKDQITASLDSSDEIISATAFACANCHGIDGEGKQEGSLVVPNIDANHLFTTTKIRPAYDDNTLLTVITKGINSQNTALNPSMPKYNLAKFQAQALVAYLKQLGTGNDSTVGLTDSEIQLATLLPMSGKLATMGNLLKATMDACVAETNNQGLIYGRKLTLTAYDSGGSQNELLAATKHLITDVKPFALIAGYFPELTSDIYQHLSRAKTPVIAPLTFAPYEEANTAEYFFNFLPSYTDQAKSLINYWLAKERTVGSSRLVIIYTDSKLNIAVRNAIREQLQHHHLAAIAEIDLLKGLRFDSKQLNKLVTSKADAVFFIGNAEDFITFNKAIATSAHPPPLLLALLAMLGESVINIPVLAVPKMLLATPFNLNVSSQQQFSALLDKYSVSLESPNLQKTACLAINLVSEALKQTGKQVSQDRLVKAISKINHFSMDIMPPLNFSQPQYQGSKGAYIISIDTKAGSKSPLSDWITAVE